MTKRTKAPGNASLIRKHGTPATLLIAALVMVATAVLLYPTGASWFAQLLQSQQADTYTTAMDALAEQQRSDQLQAARDYNADLPGGALIDPWGRTPLSDQQRIVEAYNSQLDLGPADVMARIRIPKIAVDLPVYHGTDESTLRRGIGHLLGSALPVGGPSTHSVLTGHRGLADATLFSDLDQVRVGDGFEIDVYGQSLAYRVVDVRVVDPGDTSVLTPEDDRDLVSLITCTPLGINTHRIIVTGERIPLSGDAVDEIGTMPAVPGTPWWTLLLAAGFTTAALYRTVSAFSDARRAAAHPPTP